MKPGDTLSKEQFEAYLASSGEQAFVVDSREKLEDGETDNPDFDGEVSYTIQPNGDILVECSVSKRFRKYPHPETL